MKKSDDSISVLDLGYVPTQAAEVAYFRAAKCKIKAELQRRNYHAEIKEIEGGLSQVYFKKLNLPLHNHTIGTKSRDEIIGDMYRKFEGAILNDEALARIHDFHPEFRIHKFHLKTMRVHVCGDMRNQVIGIVSMLTSPFHDQKAFKHVSASEHSVATMQNEIREDILALLEQYKLNLVNKLVTQEEIKKINEDGCFSTHFILVTSRAGLTVSDLRRITNVVLNRTAYLHNRSVSKTPDFNMIHALATKYTRTLVSPTKDYYKAERQEDKKLTTKHYDTTAFDVSG
jgi:hypothetical protein